jgi:hypothetical protein
MHMECAGGETATAWHGMAARLLYFPSLLKTTSLQRRIQFLYIAKRLIMA